MDAQRTEGGLVVDRKSRVFVAGHTGLVGSAIVRQLEHQGYSSLLLKTRSELDLREASGVMDFFRRERPTHVFLAAALVGGILANTQHPVEFFRSNMEIELNVLGAAHQYGVEKLLFLGSSCVYPRLAPQPIKEEYLLDGRLEETNKAYALAKIAGIALCEAYRSQYGEHFVSVMPTNLYGPGDNFDLVGAHVLPALIRKMHEAKVSGADDVEVWGSGKPRREFLYIDDLAEACLFVMDHYDQAEVINVGVGQDISILEVATLVAEVVGFKGRVRLDSTKPDGTPQKLLDVSKLRKLGWSAKTSLQEGLESTYRWYVATLEQRGVRLEARNQDI